MLLVNFYLLHPAGFGNNGDNLSGQLEIHVIYILPKTGHEYFFVFVSFLGVQYAYQKSIRSKGDGYKIN